MAAMLWDSAHRQDLHELVGLELQLLEMYRAQVHHQSEEPATETTFVVGDVLPDGRQKQHVRIEFSVHIGAEYARSMLEKFRPLAFLAAFRVHDMIVGWILMANGVPASGLFKFAQKKNEWNSRMKAGALQLPPEISDPRILKASWEVYEHLEPARSAMTHEGKVRILPNGTLEVKDRKGVVHAIDDKTQASYLRFISMLITELMGVRSADAQTSLLREYDLGRLQHLHTVTGFRTTGLVYDHVTIKIPPHLAKALDPYVAEIDFAHFDAEMRQKRSPGAMVYGLDVVAETPDRTLTWRFPAGRVPQGVAMLEESDPKLLPFLSVEIHDNVRPAP
jgi:hypothetical protein